MILSLPVISGDITGEFPLTDVSGSDMFRHLRKHKPGFYTYTYQNLLILRLIVHLKMTKMCRKLYNYLIQACYMLFTAMKRWEAKRDCATNI